MNLFNTAMCFAPSFLRSLVPTKDDYMIHAKTMNKAVMLMIDNKEQIFNLLGFEPHDYT